MAIRMPRMAKAKHILRRSLSGNGEVLSAALDVPKGYFAVYVGEQVMKCFVIPISYLSQSAFQELLCQAEEEFEFEPPMGGLTITCKEDILIALTSRLSQ